jgi:glycosyltransferase involved in cell wall biosynthesis
VTLLAPHSACAASAAGPPADAPIEFSVVMPCLDEARTLGACIEKARGCLEALGVGFEIIVADNGSTDGSRAVAEAAGARVVAVAARGYGSALLGGIAAARGRYVIMGDSDDSYDFAHLGPFVERLRAGYDLVMGNRFQGGIEPGAMPALHRYLGNPVLTGVGRLFFGCPCRDMHCGLRGFELGAILGLGLRSPGMEFASEMVVKATLAGLRIAEVPTTLSPDGRGRPSHLRTWRDGCRHLSFLLLYSPRWLFLFPGLLLFAGGLAAALWLLPRPRPVGGVTLDLHTLLYAAAAVIIGHQAVLFWFLSGAVASAGRVAPLDPLLARWMRRVSPSGGLVAGSLLAAFGIGMSFWAVKVWGGVSFGPLDPDREMRLVLPAVTAAVVGCQTILASLLLAVLRLTSR